MFKNIFIELLQKNNISQSKLSKETGIPEATISRWKDGLQEPSYKYINVLCNYFKISADFLLERNNYCENEINISNNENVNNNNIGCSNFQNNIELSHLEMEIAQEVKKLSKSEQIQLLANLNKE